MFCSVRSLLKHSSNITTKFIQKHTLNLKELPSPISTVIADRFSFSTDAELLQEEEARAKEEVEKHKL